MAVRALSASALVRGQLEAGEAHVQRILGGDRLTRLDSVDEVRRLQQSRDRGLQAEPRVAAEQAGDVDGDGGVTIELVGGERKVTLVR